MQAAEVAGAPARAATPLPSELNEWLFGECLKAAERQRKDSRDVLGSTLEATLLASCTRADPPFRFALSLVETVNRNTVAAATGSLVSTISGFPLDSVKARLQVKRCVQSRVAAR